jgi:hypothetical protein
MKKVLSILGLNLLCVLLLAGCTQHTAPTSRAYTNTLYGFSFDPPSGWQQIENEDNDIAVRFSPANTSNVSLIVAVPFALSEGRSLSTFADQTEENLLESGVEYSIVNRDWRTISQLQAYELAYTYEQNGITKYVKQVVVLRTRTVFLITFTTPALLAAQYLTEIDRCIETFM